MKCARSTPKTNTVFKMISFFAVLLITAMPSVFAAENSGSMDQLNGEHNTNNPTTTMMLRRRLHNNNNNQGACQHQCNNDNDCQWYGGPNKCHYCDTSINQCVETKPPPHNQGACGNSCQTDTDCVFVGGPNPCQYCVNFTCQQTKPKCYSNDFCYDDSDCDVDNGCVCNRGHYGRPNSCGEWDGN